MCGYPFYNDMDVHNGSYVARTTENETVRSALNFVIKNGNTVVGGVHQKSPALPAYDALNLTPGQAQVFKLLSIRWHNSFICELFDISVNTYGNTCNK